MIIFFNFWFRFIYPYRGSVDEREVIRAALDENFNSYVGFVFERVAKEFLLQRKPFPFTRIGRWWHKDKEIDLVALNEKSKEMGFFEVKWSDLKLRETMDILEELKEKAKEVKWNDEERKEYYGVIAKKIKGKEKLREGGFLCYDLRDFERYCS